MFVQTIYSRKPATDELVQSRFLLEVDSTDQHTYQVDRATFYWENEKTLSVYNDGDYRMTVTDSEGIHELEPDEILYVDGSGRVNLDIVITDDR